MSPVSPAKNLCLNCSADLDKDTSGKNNNRSAFYTLNCSSRVRSPFSPATVELIPVHQALATIFNLETLEKVSNTKSRSNVNGKGKEKKNLLTDFQSSTCNVPICFSCYLVLSDLYRVYTEFNQLRKANSFLGSKLKELEKELRLQGQGQGQDVNESVNTPVPSTSKVTHSSSSSGLSPGIKSHGSRPFSGVKVAAKSNDATKSPFQNQVSKTSTNPSPEDQVLGLPLPGEFDDEEPLTPLDFVKMEVLSDAEGNDDDSVMDLGENSGGVTDDEERGDEAYEDESLNISDYPSTSTSTPKRQKQRKNYAESVDLDPLSPQGNVDKESTEEEIQDYELQVVGKTNRGKDVILFRGFEYTKSKEVVSGTICYVCRRVKGRKCNARLLWYPESKNKRPRLTRKHEGHLPLSEAEVTEKINTHTLSVLENNIISTF